MREYIEREELLYNFGGIMPEMGVNEVADEMYNIAFDASTADVVEVDKVAQMLADICDCPCNFLRLEDEMHDYCGESCQNVSNRKCWARVIRHKLLGLNMEGRCN